MIFSFVIEHVFQLIIHSLDLLKIYLKREEESVVKLQGAKAANNKRLPQQNSRNTEKILLPNPNVRPSDTQKLETNFLASMGLVDHCWKSLRLSCEQVEDRCDDFHTQPHFVHSAYPLGSGS